MTGLAVAAVSGSLLLGGIWASCGGLIARHPRLSEALGLLDGGLPGRQAEAAEGVDRIGSWVRLRWALGVNDRVSRQLQLRRIGVDRFFTYKVVGALIGATVPGLLALLILGLSGFGVLIPAAASVIGAALGFLTPDLVLRRQASSTGSDATESLLTFMDLVTLERLANRSATQALQAAAGISDTAVFHAIREALQRARLQQRAPYSDLRQLGVHLDLPALGDIADVMKLDDSGASLSEALRARVKELRDAHLTATRIDAAAVSERMTLFMVIPSLIFGLVFLVPALLRLLGT